MAALPTDRIVAVIGAGTMGAGIAQVAATAGHRVLLHDSAPAAVAKAATLIGKLLDRSVEKGQLAPDARREIAARVVPCPELAQLAPAALVIEAIVENMEVKRKLFAALEAVVGEATILASNTSSLSISGMASGLKQPARVVGMHFFNPAPLMPLVEVVSSLVTAPDIAATIFDTSVAWGKSPVHARSTPGFIVNRCARPFYAEALRLLLERACDPATLDAVMRECGGFRMGPCELMDLVGLDVNLAVTKSVHAAYFGDMRYQPSPIQQEMVDSGRHGRKNGHGFFDYAPDAVRPAPRTEPTQPPPQRVLVEGSLGPAAGLVPLIARSGIPHAYVEAKSDNGVIVLDHVMLRLTDGRLAGEHESPHGRPIALFDLALDYGKARRISLAFADGTPEASRADAIGFLQALGFAVSVIDDTPGLIVMRTVAMLANEAAEAVLQGVAAPAAIDLAMMKGVSYPRGPLAWADEIGIPYIVGTLDRIGRYYADGHYRVSSLLRRRATSGLPIHGG